MSDQELQNLISSGGDLDRFRPFLKDGKSFVLKNGGISESPSPALLTPEQWAEADGVVRRLFETSKLLTDLMDDEKVITRFDGVSKAVLEYRTEAPDPDEGKPLFQLEGVPLPITNIDVEWCDDFKWFLKCLERHAGKVVDRVERTVRESLPRGGSVPDNFRLIVGRAPILIQVDTPRRQKFNVMCVIVPWLKPERAEISKR